MKYELVTLPMCADIRTFDALTKYKCSKCVQLLDVCIICTPCRNIMVDFKALRCFRKKMIFQFEMIATISNKDIWPRYMKLKRFEFEKHKI